MAHLAESVFRTLDRTAGRLGVGPGHLNAMELMNTALRNSGRNAFDEISFRPALEKLIASYENEADLSVFGRYAARFDILRALANLLRFEAMEERDPAIVVRPIVSPVIITGLPRSGTTFLHTLLAQDSQNRVPRSWQLIYPYPSESYGADCRRDRVERQLTFFRHLSPELEGMHPIAADAPQECTDITAQIFQSLRFDTTHHVPSYQKWIDAHGHLEAYRFHRRFLQHLDGQDPGGRWVLKCPDHVFTLDAVRAVYPDATIVMLHRDPLQVLASVAKLTALLRRPFARHVDEEQIGQQVAERWIDGAERMCKFADGTARAVHLRYRDVVAHPLTAVETIYRTSGHTLSAEARARMTAYLVRVPRGGYRRHSHSLSTFGLDAVALRERFARYVETFDVMPGSGPGAQEHAVRSVA